MTGSVKIFNPEKGYGFIGMDGGEDHFVHAANLLDGNALAVGARVTFVPHFDHQKNKPIAKEVGGGYLDPNRPVPSAEKTSPTWSPRGSTPTGKGSAPSKSSHEKARKAAASARSALLMRDTALEEVAAGNPPFDHALNLSPDDSLELPSTSHISIVDRFGNALSMTTTIENAFGSRLITPGGYFLNNELTDFSFRTHRDGVPIANRLEPGKRPRSSMAPTIVLKDGKPVMVVGSPGGSRIIGYVAKTIIAHLDWNLDIQAAIDFPHLINRFGTYDLEAGTTAETITNPLAKALLSLGFEVKSRNLNSGLHAISLSAGQLSGGADHRREGIAIGD